MDEFRFDPNELLKDEIIIDKFDAAKMQIVSAIKMFFFDWDAVSQHTLTGAAHEILYDISKNEGKKHSLKDSPLISDKERSKFISSINLPQNYFKHADKDHKQRLLFRYRITPFYLYDTIRMYIILKKEEPCYEIKVFLMWFQLRYPDLLKDFPEGSEKDLEEIRSETKDPETFKILGRYLLETNQKDNS
jgi:hypothetical protein